METKEMLLEALREDLNILIAWLRDMPKIEEVTLLSAEIRRVVSLIAEIDHK